MNLVVVYSFATSHHSKWYCNDGQTVNIWDTTFDMGKMTKAFECCQKPFFLLTMKHFAERHSETSLIQVMHQLSVAER